MGVRLLLETRNLKLETDLSPADEVHDLQAVAIAEFGLSPLGARDDLAIEFDSDAIALHAKLLDQLGKRQGIGKALAFAVDKDVHNYSFRFRVASFKSGL